MAVFDKASLVMIPSQYKEGKIYNIKPEDQSSSFEFERGSAATRVNSSGLIEQTGVSSTQLWNDDSIYLNGTASYNNGIVTFTASVNNDYILFQNLEGVEQSNYYEISFDTVVNSGSFSLLQGTGSSFVPNYLINETGSYKRIVQYTHATPYQILFWSSNSSSLGAQFDGTISNISIKKVNIDTPRLDYSGTEPALLLEPQRTNLMTYSDQPITNYGFSNTQNITVTQNATLSPDGSTNAMLIESTNSNSKLTVQDIDFVSGTTYTASVYVKNIDATVFNIFFYNASGTPSSTQIDKSSELNSEWTRIYATYTATANDTGISSQIQFARGLPAGESLYIWGFQVEEGAYPTSYIPTNGQAETRLADVCQGGGDASVFNDSEGTLYMEFSTQQDVAAAFVTISDGSITNRVGLFNQNGVELRSNIRLNSAQYNNLSGVNVSDGNFHKVAVKYDGSNIKLFLDGQLKDTDPYSGTFTAPLSTIEFFQGDATNSHFNGKVRALHYFSEALTDTELQQLTSNT